MNKSALTDPDFLIIISQGVGPNDTESLLRKFNLNPFLHENPCLCKTLTHSLINGIDLLQVLMIFYENARRGEFKPIWQSRRVTQDMNKLTDVLGSISGSASILAMISHMMMPYENTSAC